MCKTNLTVSCLNGFLRPLFAKVTGLSYGINTNQMLITICYFVILPLRVFGPWTAIFGESLVNREVKFGRSVAKDVRGQWKTAFVVFNKAHHRFLSHIRSTSSHNVFFFKSVFNIILPPLPRLPMCISSSCYPTTVYPSRVFFLPQPLPPPFISPLLNVPWRVHSIKLHCVEFTPYSCYFLPLDTNILLRTLIP
jgi:hypothetical protein